jgi:hypothetical protein
MRERERERLCSEIAEDSNAVDAGRDRATPALDMMTKTTRRRGWKSVNEVDRRTSKANRDLTRLHIACGVGG